MTEHEQFTTPGGGGEPVDNEPDEVAVATGESEYVSAAEELAMHIDDSEEAGGRTGDDPGYLTEP